MGKKSPVCELDCFECPYPDCKRDRHIKDREFSAVAIEITQVEWENINRERRAKGGL